MISPPAVVVDRLSLRVPGGDAELGRRLALLVAERLAPPLLVAGADGALERLAVEVAAAPGESAESLAGRIATQVARAALERSLGAAR